MAGKDTKGPRGEPRRTTVKEHIQGKKDLSIPYDLKPNQPPAEQPGPTDQAPGGESDNGGSDGQGSDDSTSDGE